MQKPAVVEKQVKKPVKEKKEKEEKPPQIREDRLKKNIMEEYNEKDGDPLFETISTDKFVVFWRAPGFMCNWTLSQFTLDGMMYNCAEQAIMHRKAVMFSDEKIAALIMKTSSPTRQIALGRKISNFDEKVWKTAVTSVAYEVVFAKFSQNTQFRDLLLDTKEKEIFEASPLDKVWGIGLRPESAARLHVRQLRNKKGNLLGRTLMKVRDALRLLQQSQQ